MHKQSTNKKSVEHLGHSFGVLILPVLSISKPSPDSRFGEALIQRVVFDWGKSLSHPNAKVAFGMLTRAGGQYFQHIIFGDNQYVVHQLKDCRSGRKAALVSKYGQASSFDLQIIQKALAQEFPIQK